MAYYKNRPVQIGSIWDDAMVEVIYTEHPDFGDREIVRRNQVVITKEEQDKLLKDRESRPLGFILEGEEPEPVLTREEAADNVRREKAVKKMDEERAKQEKEGVKPWPAPAETAQPVRVVSEEPKTKGKK
jgi:hypothetical protein